MNLLAANLTTQVRAIAEVATAVTKGDLTRSIQVDARGEVAELKDNINTMIDNLRLTTDRNTEQDWLKTNLARFTGMLQGQRDLTTVGKLLLSELVPLVNAHQGVIYQMDVEPLPMLKLLAGYAETPGHEFPQLLQSGARVHRAMRKGQAPHPRLRHPEGHHACRIGVVPGPASKCRRAAGELRRADQGGHQSRLAR